MTKSFDTQNPSLEGQHTNAKPQHMPTPDTVKVFNLIVLDESGSRFAIWRETIDMVNGLIETILMPRRKILNKCTMSVLCRSIKME